MASHQQPYLEHLEVCINCLAKRSLIESSYYWLSLTAYWLGIKISNMIFELGMEIGIAADNQIEKQG
ncbi:MAG: hypothetical protein ACWGP1_09845 [Syntrophobacteria bacterium]|jgi:hypothetical protein